MCGILFVYSCTFCGMAMRKYVEVNVSHKSKTTIKYVMKMLASVAEAVIFMFLGVCAVSDTHVWNTEFVLITVFFCLTFRAVGMYSVASRMHAIDYSFAREHLLVPFLFVPANFIFVYALVCHFLKCK